MNMFRSLLVVFGLIAALPGQDQATTLLAACRSADVVVQARVDQATDPSPEWHRLRFTTELRLKGEIADSFTLLEPAGPCCGRALFALQIGDHRLLFLRRTGASLHPFGGDRGVLAADAAVLAHVRDLLGAHDAAETTARLCEALASPHTRLAADAAHALATLPTLTLDATARERVTDALQSALAGDAPYAASLLEVATRARDVRCIDTVLDHYLGCDEPHRAKLVQQALARCDTTLVTTRLPLQTERGGNGPLRRAELLAALPAEDATGPLLQLLRSTSCARARLCATQALLGFGAGATALPRTATASVVDLAEQRRNAPPRFRSIDPTRR